MATITNLHNLPAAVVAAVQNDPYVGGGDISTTKLIDSPRIRVLSAKHKDNISVDVSERVWALLGQAVQREVACIDRHDDLVGRGQRAFNFGRLQNLRQRADRPVGGDVPNRRGG